MIGGREGSSQIAPRECGAIPASCDSEGKNGNQLHPRKLISRQKENNHGP
jgi:hypothetical protein